MRFAFVAASLSFVAALGCSSAGFDVAAPGDGDAANPQDSSVGIDSPSIDTTPTSDGIAPTDAVDDTGVTAGDACNVLAKAQCGKLASCYDGFFFGLLYGDGDFCVARLTASCLGWIDAPGVTWRHLDVRRCADAITTEDCTSVENGVVLDKCIPSPGTLADGKGCVHAAQCASSSCDFATTSDGCGVCRPGGPEALCNTACAPNLVCMADNKCRAPVPVGGGCDHTSNLCVNSASCVGKTCVAKATAKGAVCDDALIAGPQCDGVYGLRCTVAHQCDSIALASSGGACGTIGTAVTACRGPDVCQSAMCSTPLADGQSCDSTKPPCTVNAHCIAGHCAIPDGTVCPPG